MKISAVIVLYKPNVEMFLRVIKSLQTQVNKLYVIVNEEQDYDFSEFSNVDIEILGKNYGIAYAQNRGINKALKSNADYILLSDQDTIYPENYIESFLPFIKNNTAAVYCPIFYDNIKKVYSPIMIKKFTPYYNIEEPTFVQQAIASGTIIDCSIFASITSDISVCLLLLFLILLFALFLKS